MEQFKNIYYIVHIFFSDENWNLGVPKATRQFSRPQTSDCLCTRCFNSFNCSYFGLLIVYVIRRLNTYICF